MWASLANLAHLEFYHRIQEEEWSPMLRVVETLTQKEYAATLLAFTSLYHFCITTAPEYNRLADHGVVTITFDSRTKLFRVTYGDRRNQAKYVCEEKEISPLIDSLALRLILTAPQKTDTAPSHSGV
jgi:hypothetical protein